MCYNILVIDRAMTYNELRNRTENKVKSLSITLCEIILRSKRFIPFRPFVVYGGLMNKACYINNAEMHKLRSHCLVSALPQIQPVHFSTFNLKGVL